MSCTILANQVGSFDRTGQARQIVLVYYESGSILFAREREREERERERRVLSWIQTVLHCDSVPEIIFEKFNFEKDSR